ncbi:MAG TPA: NAD(P)-dependent oxidoreductase [Micromonosporaceae bacterium]|nr:NAD(P)-dependent oxidoreductase [Micromonosporaceae bacterium]
MARVAWIGLGAMGSRMARRLLDAGHEVSVWNRTPARAEPLVAAGARVAATPADAVGDAEAVLLMLSDPQAIRAVAEGPEGIAAGVRPDTIVIDMSTVGPAAVARLRSALPDEVPVLDAPVLGSITEAEAGDLTIFVGGVTETVEAAAPLLSVLGNPIHVGASGAGAAAKLVANSILLGVLGVLGEALALGDGLGLPREAVWRILEASPMAAQAQRRRPVVESGSAPRRFALSLAHKDADLVLSAADAAGVELRLARAARSWFADADTAGIGDADYSTVLRHILQS